MWDTHSDPSNPEPNDKTGIEKCIRMKGNVFNDAKCDLSTTGPARSGNGMGYICEFDPSRVAPVSPARSMDSDNTNYLECGHNVNVEDFVVKPGCPAPYSCEDGPQLSISDSWFKVQKHGSQKVKTYGFAAKVHLPESMRSDAWSILIRFSNLNTKGNFQLWNANFFNFYNGGYEILIQKKWWNMDRVDESSFMFVAENLNSDEYPEIVGFKGRVQKHSCFDSRMHSGMRGSASGGFVQAMANKLSETAEGARTSASDMAELIFKNLDNVSKVRVNKRKFKIPGKL